mgnify:CR=1 FL=1
MNWSDPEHTATGKTKTFWYDGLGLWRDKVKGQVYDSDPTVPPKPVAPKVTVSPKAYLGETFEITVTSLVNLTSGSDTLTIGGKSTKVSIGKNTFNVADYTTAAKTLTVTGTLANEAGSTVVNASIEVTEKPVLKLVTDPKELRIYQVMVSSFQDGDPSRGFTRAYGPSNALKGGDLQGIINAADYIKDLGCNAIWMTPIFESNGGGELDSTGYFAYDYFNIDDQFGTNEKFAEYTGYKTEKDTWYTDKECTQVFDKNEETAVLLRALDIYTDRLDNIIKQQPDS